MYKGPHLCSTNYLFWNRFHIILHFPTFGGRAARWKRFLFLCSDLTDQIHLVGGFIFLLFSTLPGEDFQFDSYFSNGLKPPTSFLGRDCFGDDLLHHIIMEVKHEMSIIVFTFQSRPCSNSMIVGERVSLSFREICFFKLLSKGFVCPILLKLLEMTNI